MTGFLWFKPEFSIGYFDIYKHLKLHAQSSWEWKRFYNLEAFFFSGCARMGYYSQTDGASGSYYLSTTSAVPFC